MNDETPDQNGGGLRLQNFQLVTYYRAPRIVKTSGVGVSRRRWVVLRNRQVTHAARVAARPTPNELHDERVPTNSLHLSRDPLAPRIFSHQTRVAKPRVRKMIDDIRPTTDLTLVHARASLIE